MKSKINFFYQQYATTFMTIDEDYQGLVCTVPSESNGESYIVRCTEYDDHVDVEKCSCQGHKYYGYCKHETIVQEYWDKMYKTNIQKAQEKQVQQAILEAEEMLSTGEVAIEEEQVVPPAKGSDTLKVVSAPQIATSTPIIKMDYRSKQTASFFAGLSSKQRDEAA